MYAISTLLFVSRETSQVHNLSFLGLIVKRLLKLFAMCEFPFHGPRIYVDRT